MALDANDYNLLKSLRNATRETGEATAQRLDKIVDAQRTLISATEKSLGNDERLIEAFNRMAEAVDNLASEVKQLRADLAPPVDKPKRLPQPQ